ncbi:MAG: nitronate monooxygenase [Deltaproteobacteria bacterium]|nr:nitronate monooxygenase [Deltaproteobacteria bacterium]
MKTRITELLEIQYPIVLASMAWITDAALAAAVSEAGGLGTIGPNSGSETVTTDVKETGERLRVEIRKCRSLTNRPFAVNFVVGVGGLDRKFSDCCVEVGIEEKVPVAIVSQGSPRVYTARLKEAGMKVIHVCSTVRHVRNAEESGVDAVVASGTEGGGHSGFDQITSLCLVPQAVEAVKIPVIAGGGIVNARGFMGALALGAEGVYMGTRFIATQECPAHINVKQALLINDAFYRRFTKNGGRLSYDEAISDREQPDPNVQSNRTVDAYIRGNLDTNSITVGQGAGLIKDIPACRDLIERIMREAKPILHRMNEMYS